MKNQKKYFVGIDLGWKEKKTTGVCILTEGDCRFCKDILGKNIFKTLSPYLKETQVIAVDAPLTLGRGKGKFRLYEKFLSTRAFRQEKINPVPPALMSKLADFGRELVEKFGKKGFVLGINLIETSTLMLREICKDDWFLKCQPCQTENQKSALICAQVASLHLQFKTRYLGYKDGFLFLPETSFWKENWKKKIYQAWKERDRLRYHHLITNIF